MAKKEFSINNNPEEITALLNKFKQNSQRITDPKQKDINYWRAQGVDEFKEFVKKISDEHSSKRTVRAKVKASGDEILTVVKDETRHLFFPLSKEASCFYGVQGVDGKGGWCISTKSGRNYFYDYTVRHEGVIALLIYEKQVYALVFDPDGTIKECRDKLNTNSFPPETFFKYAGISKEQLMKFTRANLDKIRSEYKKLITDLHAPCVKEFNELYRRGLNPTDKELHAHIDEYIAAIEEVMDEDDASPEEREYALSLGEITSGAMESLEHLVEDQMLDARRIVDKHPENKKHGFTVDDYYDNMCNEFHVSDANFDSLFDVIRTRTKKYLLSMGFD